MKRIIAIILVLLSMLLLSGCEEADAIKNGIKDKLPKPEEHEVIEAIMDKPTITDTYKNNYSLLVVQESNAKTIIAVLEGTSIRYSVPNWFGDTNIEVGTYILVEHADNSLPTAPMQFGFIYSMKYYAKNGSVIDGIKP